MSQNTSDYKLDRPSVHELLPAVNQNPLIKAIAETTYDRFYTKPELQRVIGTIGTRKSTSVDDRIVEVDAYDQAFQLQPAIRNAAASEVQISTYKDLKRLCAQLGIDVDRVREWENTDQFNYAPPIDLNKIVNYNEYYWVGTSLPEYVTIANPQLKLQVQLSQLVSFYGSSNDQSATWAKIVELLDLVNANVRADQRITIPNLDVVLADQSHPPYVATAIAPSDLYAIKSDWSAQNKWVHRLDVVDLSTVTQAKMPIIEYNDNVQLTEYTYTGQVWQYRRSPAYPWETNTDGPSQAELFQRFPVVGASRSNDTVTVDGDVRDLITVGEYITIEDAALYSGIWLVMDVVYFAAGDQTVIHLNANITTDQASGFVRPFATTSLGDEWKGIHTHWMLLEVQAPRPSAPPTAAELLNDQGKELVADVRTSTDENAPHETVSLVRFRRQEQRKMYRNQYPMFDVVDMHGTSQRKSMNIFTFAESATAPVDTVFGARIVRDLLTKDFTFNVDLVQDDGSLQYYVDTTTGSPASIWSAATPYVPTKVDTNGSPVADDVDGAAFEIPHQLSNNVHHECRNTLKYSELFLHFKSIVDHQPSVDVAVYGSALNASNSYRLRDVVDYSKGGTIKEYNYSFDNFVSSLVSSQYNLPAILSFAEAQYNEMLVRVRESVEQNVVTALTQGAATSPSDLTDYLEGKVLASLRNDTNLSRIYGDSSVTIKSSVSNWIATLPYLRLARAVAPEVLRDDKLGILELVHHDGHSSAAELNNITERATRSKIIDVLGLYPNRVQQSRPSVNVQPGTMWYDSATDTLYRKSVSADLWEKFDLVDVVTSVLLKIESRLAVTSPTARLWTDNLSVSDVPAFQSLMQLEFEDYCKANGITDPYVGNFNASDPFTWNYSSGHTGRVCWQDVNATIYGTPYPHLQPWKLQGYDTEPTWWNDEYNGDAEGRRWTASMWTNIMQGVVPANRPQPSHTVQPVTKVSVNTTAIATADGYGPDDLLPPYWVPAVQSDNRTGVADQATYSSMLDRQAIAVNTFAFGEEGPVERTWHQSIDYKYATLRCMFRMDPIRFMHYTFGEEYVSVGGLQVSARTNKVLSHRDVVFHGDADARGETQIFDGVNQLYVNFFRYNALDLNGSEFKRAWTSWTTQLCYNVGSFVIDNTLSVSSPLFEMTPNDYTVEVKTARRVRDVWIDALYASIAQVGSQRELPLGAGRDWKFHIGTHCPVARPTNYYGTKKYRIVSDAATNTFTMVEGSLTLAGWAAGSAIVLDLGTNGILPNAVDDMSYYFVIPVSDTSFQIAESKELALIGHNMNLLTNGNGIYYAGELVSTFYALEGKHTPILWKHFTINKNDVRSFSSGVPVTGIQNIVDFVDGYSSFLADQGVVFNDSSVPEYDASTNRQITWQYELESLIDTLYANGTTLASTNGAAAALGEVELNPFRNNVWVTHPQGVVAEFNSLDVKDSSAMAVVYDTQGNRLDTRSYHVLRQDTMTQISMINQMQDGAQVDSYGMIVVKPAIGGLHAYFDEYEHVLMFKPYTISNALIYDSFLGIAVQHLNTYFEKQSNSTKRPNVGGFVMKGGKLIQNYEHTVGNMLKYYDTFTVNENSDFVNYARRLLGYTANETYMTNTNVTAKSQFLFYKGMIKAKGTLGSIQAYTNSKHFSSADVDEFWAYRAFDFGDNRTKVTYTMALVPQDTARSHAKFEFVADPSDTTEEFFTKIVTNDDTRWPNFPTQAGNLSDTHAIFGTKASSDVAVVPVTKLVGTEQITVVEHEAADAIMVYRVGEPPLTEGVDYIRLTNSIVKLNANPSGLRLSTHVPDYGTIAPIHIYDRRAKVAVADVPAWDPAAGIHQAELSKYVELMSDTDPATYTTSVLVGSNDSGKCWNSQEVGALWLDTNSFSYLDYKDLNLSTGERLIKWGKLEEWSDPAVYQWVESDVAPKNYTDGIPRAEVYSRKREVYTATVATGALTLDRAHDLVAGDEIVVSSTGNMPSPLGVGVIYTVASASDMTVLVADRTGVPITLVGAGSGTVTVSKASFVGEWSLVSPAVEHHSSMDIDESTNTLITLLPAGAEYSMFVDGTFVQDGPVQSNGTVLVDADTMAILGTKPHPARLTVVRKTGIVDGLSDKQPTDLDLTAASEQLFVGYPCSKVDHISVNGVVHQPLYYFWARKVVPSVDDAKMVTTTALEQMVHQNDGYYMICQKPSRVDGEVRMSQLIIAGLTGIVSEANRFTLQMNKDYTLRHELYDSGAMRKTSHSEWIMFREKQNQHIDRSLWNMLTESIVGYSLQDSSIAVPSLDRVIYDNVNGTATRYGIGRGQAFVPRDTALNTILLELNSPETDFDPIDIDFFLETHDTTTTAGLIKFMADIYDSFHAKHVNKLFFAVMMDALANINVDYSGSLMKTSAISINGNTPLNVNGEFDE